MATPPSFPIRSPGEASTPLVPVEQSAQSPALLLSDELILGFMRYLNPKELLTAGQVCKHFQIVADDSRLWKLLFESRFGRCDHLENNDYLKAYRDRHRIHFNFTNGVYASKFLPKYSSLARSLFFSQDGTLLITGDGKRIVRIWDLAANKWGKTHKEDSASINSVILSQDNKQLITASSDTTITIWSLAKSYAYSVLEGHAGPVNSIVLSADGKQLISGSDDRTIRIWDLATHKCLKILEGHAGPINSVVLSADGKQLISGSDDRTIRIWDLAKGKCLKILEGHTHSISSLARSADGELLISGSNGGTIKIWDLATGACINTLKKHTSLVSSLALSPDDKYLISASWDTTIRVWDLAIGASLYTFEEHKGQVQSLALSPDGTQFVSGFDGGVIKFWNFDTTAIAVFKEIAYQFRLDARYEGVHRQSKGYDNELYELSKLWHDQRNISDIAMDRFSMIPKRERAKVYAELCQILNPIEKDLDQEGQDAFHERLWIDSTSEQKAQAIENYLARSS